MTGVKATGTTLEISGFGVPSGPYSYLELKPLYDQDCGKPIIGNLTRGETDLKRKDLVPGCDYHLRYSAVCRADAGLVESAVNYLDICTSKCYVQTSLRFTFQRLILSFKR